MNETTNQSHTLRGVVCTTVGGVFWGFSGTCGQYLLSSYPISPLWITCVRILASGTILTAVAAVRQREKMRALLRQPRELWRIFLFGALGLTMCQVAYMVSIDHSNAATTTVLQNLSLLFIMLCSCLQSRRLPNRRERAALLLALGGTYILATGGDPRHMVLSPKGLFWGILTAVAVTIYSIQPRKLLPRWGWEPVTGLGMLFGGITLNLATRSWTYSVQLPPAGWAALAAIMVFGGLLAFPMFMQGVADIGPVRSSMLAATEPVSATVFSALWLGTRFSPTDLIGFACIIATIFLLAKNESE